MGNQYILGKTGGCFRLTLPTKFLEENGWNKGDVIQVDMDVMTGNITLINMTKEYNLTYGKRVI